ncbi:unnamed protein product [Fusarium fujikuroi]|nr:unnamed protein product [Fusarium fujikuroi]
MGPTRRHVHFLLPLAFFCFMNIQMRWIINEADGQETWITFLVRYVDQFEKRDGSWKISHRFVAFDVVSGKAIMQYLPKANLGTRDEEDYSRKVLKD